MAYNVDDGGGFSSVENPYAFLIDRGYVAGAPDRWFTGTHGQLSAADEARAWNELQADPLFERIGAMPAPFGNLSIENAELNNYAFNDPRSPLYGLNVRESVTRGTGAYRVVSGGDAPIGIEWVQIIPDEWYLDPGVVGPIAVGTVAGISILAPFIGGGGAVGAAGGGASAAGGAGGLTGAGVLGGVTAATAAARSIAAALGRPDPTLTVPASLPASGEPAGATLPQSVMLAAIGVVALVLFRK